MKVQTFFFGMVVCYFLAFSGCSTLTSYPLEEETQKLSFQKPLDLKMAVLPLKISYQPTTNLTNPEEYLVTVDKEPFLHSFLDVIRKSKFFSSPQNSLKKYQESEQRQMSLKDYLEKAWEEKEDLLMEVELEKYKLSYQGVGTGTYLLNLFLWMYLWAPSWWVADELYRAEIALKVRIYSVHSGNLIWEQKIEETREDYVNDWDRGWKLFGIFTVPSYLSISNWKTVRESFAPWVEEKMKYSFLKALHQFQSFAGSDVFEEKMKKTLALVVGISDYKDSEIRSTINYSAKDAGAFYDFLSPRIRRAKILVNNKATKQEILFHIQDFLTERARGKDVVFIYFAGYGAALKEKESVPPELYLIPFDGNFSNLPQTSISLKQLMQACSQIHGDHLWVFLDTSLGGSLSEDSLKRRSLTYEWNTRYLKSLGKKGIQEEDLRKITLKMPQVPPQMTLVLSSSVDQDCIELEENKRGLFNFYLLKGLEQTYAGKESEKKSVMFDQIYRYVEKKVASQARKRYGLAQEIQCIPEIPSQQKWIFENLSLEKEEKKAS